MTTTGGRLAPTTGLVPRPRSATRFAQLTHASFDRRDGASRGGWQVKDVTPGLTETERARLLAAVTTSITLRQPLSDFPSRDEVEALPRRLTMTVEADGSAVFSHACLAGDDASGRRGNVFAHVLLDRHLLEVLEDGPAERPVQLWRSPGWLTPFGAEEVLAATVDESRPPAHDGPVTREEVARFLLDPDHYRFSALALLLDAVAAALDGGPRVLVLADSVDEGARWIGAVSWLAAAPTCGRLTFSTYARWHEAVADPALPVLTVVLRDDLPPGQVRAEHVVVVDPLDEPERETTEDGTAFRRTRFDALVPVSDWSALALDVLAAEDGRVLERLAVVDEIARSAGARAEDCPWWALAVVVAQTEDLRLSWGAAAAVVLASTPAHLSLTDGLGRDLTSLLLTCAGRSAQEAHDLLRADGSGRGPLQDLMRSVYLERAVCDADWLLQDGGPPAAGRVRLGEDGHLQGVGQRGMQLLLESARPPAEVALAGLRLLDLLARSEVPLLPGGDEVRSTMAERIATQLASEQAGPLLVQHCRRLHPEVVRDWVVPRLAEVVERVVARPGARLPVEVLLWLGDSDAYDESTALPADRLVADVVVAICSTTDHLGLRALAAKALLESAEWRPASPPAERVESALELVRGSSPWQPDELLTLVDQLGDRADLDLVPSVIGQLRGSPPTATTSRLAATTSRRLAARRPALVLAPEDERLLEVYAVLTPGWHLDDVEVLDRAVDVVAAADELMRAGSGDAVQQPLAEHVFTAALALAVHRGASARVLDLGHVAALERAEPFLEALVGSGAEAVPEAVTEILEEYPRAREALTSRLVRRVLDRAEPPRPGLDRLFLRARPGLPWGCESLAELALASYWRSRPLDAAEQERDRWIQDRGLDQRERKDERRRLADWWHRLLPDTKRGFRWR